jgi:hypothetical protein
MKITFLRKNINIIFLSSLLLKNKILTFLSIALGMIIIFSYGHKENNKLIVTAKVRGDLPYSVILKIKNFNPNHDVQIYFERALQLKISSYKNFLEFINQNNNKFFLEMLDKYNLNTNLFFSKNLTETKSDNIIQYFFTYPEEINGNNFLNNYIIFSKEKIIDEIYLDLKFYIDAKINKNLYFLEIAKDLNIENPAGRMFDNESQEYSFNKGKKVLLAEISQLRKDEKLLSKAYLDWDPFINEAFGPELKFINQTKYEYIFLKIIFGFLLGIFIAFLFIFLKNTTKNI